jgi:hypothetical protein
VIVPLVVGKETDVVSPLKTIPSGDKISILNLSMISSLNLFFLF